MSGDLRSANTLFQITEPDAGNELRRRPRGRAIGIDLGTTHSLVAIAPNGEAPRALAHEDGEQGELLASVVAYVPGESPRVGADAQAQASAHPKRVLASVKRFMGRGAADIDFAHPYELAEGEGAARFVLGDQERSPVEASAEILKALRARANRALGGTEADQVQGAVITVPAYFDDAQRQATKDAGRIAGLEVYRLLAEPTAAAVAYGLDRGGQGLFAIYDLGGGTFDISLLRLRDGVFQVLATGGDSALGGDDFDRALAADLATRAGKELSTLSPTQLHVVLGAARAAKEALSSSDEVQVALPELGLANTCLRKAELESLVAPWIRKTIRACRSALKDADLAAEELDGVVLVGGSTRVPAVRDAVEKFFGRPPLTDLDPDKVVAYGAAITADILSGSEREGVTLLDVVPLSLGLETMGGIVEKIIPRNATIPIAARQVFTNYAEKQTGMSIHVVQGERELAEQNRSLAQFELKGMPALPPGMARVEVTFQLDADALLTVTATELMTGVQQRVEVKPTYGLSDGEVDQLVMESLDFAGEDFAARALAEERVELGRVALAVRTAFDEVGTLESLLPLEERPELLASLEAAEGAMAASQGKDADARALKALRERLEHSSAAFARRRMERALLAGMQGQSLAEIESALAEEEDLERRRGAHNAETIESD